MLKASICVPDQELRFCISRFCIRRTVLSCFNVPSCITRIRTLRPQYYFVSHASSDNKFCSNLKLSIHPIHSTIRQLILPVKTVSNHRQQISVTWLVSGFQDSSSSIEHTHCPNTHGLQVSSHSRWTLAKWRLACNKVSFLGSYV
jgi:hypothetical protein